MGTKFSVVCVSIKKNETKSNGRRDGAIMSTKFADDTIIDSFIDISMFFFTFTFLLGFAQCFYHIGYPGTQ